MLRHLSVQSSVLPAWEEGSVGASVFWIQKQRADSQSSSVAGLGASPGLWTPTSELLSLVSMSVVAAEPVGLGE